MIQHFQDDIHNNNPSSVADILPFSDDGSFGPTGVTCPGSPICAYGDVNYVRDHFTYIAADDSLLYSKDGLSFFTSPFGFSVNQTTHQSNAPVVVACNGGVPLDGPTPTQECGGDVGGALVPVGTTTPSTGVNGGPVGSLQ